MKLYFLAIEILIVFFFLFMIVKKKQLSVVYFLPFLFSRSVITSTLPASVNYLIITLTVFYFMFYNLTFVKKNFFTILISFYFIILLLNTDDFEKIRPYLFGSITLFLMIGIIPEIYKNYSESVVFDELANASILVLLIFCTNSLFSTFYNYNPNQMYGINSGVLYGNIVHSDFHVLPLAIFIVFRKALRDKNLFYLLVYLITIFITILTFRRTVMALSILGSIICIYEFMSFQNIRKMFILILSLSVVLILVVFSTGFLDVFWERYELRNLENRDIESELRYQELGLVYKDLFVHYDYSPWFGYKLFQFGGQNYGKGIFGHRPLHTDLMVLIHSSGLLGLLLYTMMVGYAFITVWFRLKAKKDFIQFLFVFLVFAVFFGSGRFTNTASSLIIYFVLFIPFSKNKKFFYHPRHNSNYIKENHLLNS
ncbi:hypothetical protein [Aquiflexum lacus]|uniref:hypothetical protein n=1 Tax=Aquiflexum lacus TaxID=2483805 RepID=UPI0018959050|nr:hypothetical protein [Aquiflexum lacus]